MLDFDGLLGHALGAFGARVLYAAPHHLEITVPAIFDRVSHGLEFGDMAAPVATSRAQIALRLSDLPPDFAPMQGDTVQVALLGARQVHADAPPPGAVIESYTVVDVQPDGAGGVIVPLSAREPDALT